MIKSLSIQNYALISQLEIEFNKGLSIITGETGAGKSILLGALSLVLGQRADTSVLKDKEKKCVIEAGFNIKKYFLRDFFSSNDIDYDDFTVLRREIAPNGKTRAFINDTPVNISLLKDLGDKLVDIHSQHENLLLNDNQFQLIFVDSYAKNSEVLNEYKTAFKNYKKALQELNDLEELAFTEKADSDYFQFQFDQLEAANLENSDQAMLESELETITHAEEIKSNFSKASYLLANNEYSILSQLKEAVSAINLNISFFPTAKGLHERIQSCFIELEDLSREIEIHSNDIEINPERASFIKEKLDNIYDLCFKHKVKTINELIEIKNKLARKFENISNYDSRIEELKKEITKQKLLLIKAAVGISEKRMGLIPEINQKIVNQLQLLGIQNAQFKIQCERLKEININGIDQINILFSANKNIELQDITKVISGGEMSRVMLSIKSLISESATLPTIIFDEIDTGVSGDIADKMGNIMKQMSKNMQVFSITHLPQVASKGDYHYLVFKEDVNETTITNLKLLNKEERILEIAKMLSGKELTEAALSNAKELLRN